jgi:hypothetical protein
MMVILQKNKTDKFEAGAMKIRQVIREVYRRAWLADS